jgi:hypothetical protein
MKNKEILAVDKEVKEIFIITMDVIEECLGEALEKIETFECNPCKH